MRRQSRRIRSHSPKRARASAAMSKSIRRTGAGGSKAPVSLDRTPTEPRPHQETEYLAIFDEGPLAIKFQRRLEDFFTSLASGRKGPSSIHTDYCPEADEPFRTVLLKALLVQYDPRVASSDRVKMRKFLARNITMLWFPGLPRTRGRKRTVSEPEQRAIPPLYMNLLRL